MKSLLILRHAKSSLKHPELTDHDRPLNKRGKNDASRMGDLLKNEKLIPDLIISSTALRAVDTAKTVAKRCCYKDEIILYKSLYAAEPQAYFEVLHDISDDYDKVLVVGHNPGIEELLEILTDEIHKMPTCSLAHLRLKIIRWSDIDHVRTKGELVDIWVARDLK